MKPEFIKQENCTYCNKCVEVCITGKIKEIEGTYHITEEDCMECGHCISICPGEAIISSLKSIWPAMNMGDSELIANFLKNRRSVRLYSEKVLSRKIIEKLVETACYAPSAVNCQNREFLVITKKELLKEIKEMVKIFYEEIIALSENKDFIKSLENTMPDKAAYLKNENLIKKTRALVLNLCNGKDSLIYNAPVLVIVHADKYSPMAQENCCYALYNMILHAHSMGIGSCINGFVTNALNGQKKIRDKLLIPYSNQIYTSATFGYRLYDYMKIPERYRAKIAWF